MKATSYVARADTDGVRRASPGLIAIVAFALATAVLLLYAPVAQHEFVTFDDPGYIYANPQVRAGLTADGAAWAFTQYHMGNWHPLTWLSHMTDVQLFGLDAGRHHLVSVGFHALNAALLLLLLLRLTGSLWASALAAALFALHPLRVESVAWAAERKDVLAGSFWLLTLLAYTRFARQPCIGRYLPVLLLFALGLMTKPMLATLPCVLLLLDAWPLDRWHPPRLRCGALLVLEKLPLFALLVPVTLWTLAAQDSAGTLASLDTLSLPTRVAQAALAWVHYVGATVWPTGLACFYPQPALAAGGSAGSTTSLTDWLPMVAGLALLAVTVLALRSWPRRPYIGVGWLWYLGTSLPVVGLVHVGQAAYADRYTYLPSIGLLLIVACAARELLDRHPRLRLPMVASTLVVLLALGVTTRAQLATWQDSAALYEQALAVTDDNWVAHDLYALVLQECGEFAAAEQHELEALRIHPDYSPAHSNLGNLFLARGDPARAATHYRSALRTDAGSALLHYNLGNALVGLGEWEEAATCFERALALDPASSMAANNLGMLCMQRGELKRAAELFEQALATDPDDELARANLAEVQTRRRQ